MNLIIRAERADEHDLVDELVKMAFQAESMSDHQEHRVLSELRKSHSFIPDLSIVAELNGQIVAYVLFNPIIIHGEHKAIDAVGIAPICVHPKFQKKGIASQLIQKGHEIVEAKGYPLVVLVAYPSFYEKLGYEPAWKYGVQFSFDIDDSYCFVKPLAHYKEGDAKGCVQYPKAFGLD